MYKYCMMIFALVLGQQIVNAHSSSESSSSFMNSQSEDDGLVGPRGPVGPVGPQGPPGVAGGSTGSTGPTGLTGASGETVNANFASLKLIGAAGPFAAGTNINFSLPNSANTFGNGISYNDATGEINVTCEGNYLISYGFSGDTSQRIAQILINGATLTQKSSISTVNPGQLLSQTIIARILLINGVGTISLQAVNSITLTTNTPELNPLTAYLEIVQIN